MNAAHLPYSGLAPSPPETGALKPLALYQGLPEGGRPLTAQTP
jgi:hypothetical protein